MHGTLTIGRLVVPRGIAGSLLVEHPEAILFRLGPLLRRRRLENVGRFVLMRRALRHWRLLLTGRIVDRRITPRIVGVPTAIARTPLQFAAVVVGRHSILVPVTVPHRRLLPVITTTLGRNFQIGLLTGRRLLPVAVHRQLKLFARILQRTVRDSVVEVHDQSQRHPDREPD